MRVVPAHSSNFLDGRRGVKVSEVVIHVADGTFLGTLDWFSREEAPASAHYTVSMTGELGQSVAEYDAAFHAGNWEANLRSIGVEHEGMPSRGPWVPTPEMLRASAKLVAGICKRHDIVPTVSTIVRHSVYNPRHNCPGPTWPMDRYIRMVQEELAALGAHAPGTGKRGVRLFLADGNRLLLGGASYIEGTDKVYVRLEDLKRALLALEKEKL